MVGQPEPGRRKLQPEVPGREGVGIAQRSKGDVAHRPGTDTRDRQQALLGLAAVGSDIEHELSVGELAGKFPHGGGPRLREAERLEVCRSERLRRGEGMGEGPVRSVEGLAVGSHEAAGHRPSRSQRDVLAQDHPDRPFGSVDGSGCPQAGAGSDQPCDDLVGPEDGSEGLGVCIEVEQPPTDDPSVIPVSALRSRLEGPVQRLTCGNGLYDAELLRRVDARLFPRAVIELRDASPVGATGRYHVEGVLTFHGVTRSVAGSVAVSFPEPGRMVIDGEQMLDMRHFEITPPAVAILRIYPEVRVQLHVEADVDA